MSSAQIAAFLSASGVTPAHLSMGLRLLLSFLACIWGAWVVIGLLRHLRLDADSGDVDELSILSRLLRLSLVVMVLLILAYQP